MEKCYIGSFTNTDCHLASYSDKKILYNLSELTEENIVLLRYRLRDKQFSEKVSDGKICHHHKLSYLDYFTSQKLKCCDPLKKHKKVIHDSLRVISLETCENFNKVLSKVHSINLIPGDKWCRFCEITIKEIVERNLDDSEPMEIEDVVHEEQTVASDNSATLSNENPVFENLSLQTCSSSSYYQSNSQEVDIINNVLRELKINPINKSKLSTERLQKQAEGALIEVLDKLTRKINSAYNLNIPNFNTQITQNLIEDSHALKDIILNLQNKFEQSKTISEKIEILTLLPLSWQFNQVKKYFNCSKYMYEEVKELRVQNGKV